MHHNIMIKLHVNLCVCMTLIFCHLDLCPLFCHLSVKLISHEWKQQKTVLWKCCPLIIEFLDIDAILPYLMSEELITDDDFDALRNIAKTRNDKILHLIGMLHKKPVFFEKFLNCLHQSANGTAHAEIARKLIHNIMSITDQS